MNDAAAHFAIDPRRPDEAGQERYLRAVLGEMSEAAPGRPADTLYVGGGTPSLLTPEGVARLVVELSEGRLRLAEAGVLVSNELFQAFV